ncbi:Ephrin type-A receptor 7, partial [Tulasnella sp. 408]
LNILINDQGGALLSNFGLGTAIGEKRAGLPTTVGFKDDIRYCSPEALQTSKLKTPSDMWAWGCIALEIISDKKPYHGLSGAQALSFICGDAQTRKVPEPGDSSAIPPVMLELLRECWKFGPYQRVGIE